MIKTSIATMALACLLVSSQANAKQVIASYYWQPQAVACGGRFNPQAMTTAHKTLPCGTKLRVSKGNRSVVVTVNDRGPFIKGRTLDLSLAAAKKLGCDGVCQVNMEIIKR